MFIAYVRYDKRIGNVMLMMMVETAKKLDIVVSYVN
jgi:hypothetical protein